MTKTNKCEFCDKRGLPLLLVRDAIARAGGGAPVANELPVPLAPAAAHYTRRVLRSGYVNVYDEARKRWDTYFVTTDGYLCKLPATTSSAAAARPPLQFACSAPAPMPEQHRALASCITVPDPKHATKVWIGFSDALWTDAVRARNASAAYRKKHMQVVDVAALLAGQPVPHARPIAQLSAIVAEYAMSDAKGRSACGWSAYGFVSRQAQGPTLIKEAEALRPGKGHIVTLADPAALAQELALLMKHNSNLFMKLPQYERKLAASSAIDQIEASVRKQGELGEIAAAADLANQQEANNPLGHLLFESTRKRTEELRNVTKPELIHASNEAWGRYTKKFDDKARKAWMKDFEGKLVAYDAKYISPLATSHVAWMKSSALAAYFECNYDDADIHSGLVYTSVMTHCIGSTQDKKACAALYEAWLGGDIDDKKNLLLQAMIFGQQAVATSVKSSMAVSIDIRQIPWDSIFGVYSTAMSKVNEGAQDAAARLLVEFVGPLARVLGKVVDGSPKYRAAIMCLGLVSGHPVVQCEVTGGRKAFRAKIIRELVRASGQSVNENQMRMAVSAEMKRLQIHGTPMAGTVKKRWLILADKQVLKNMPANYTPKQRAEWLARSLRTTEQVEALNLGRWRAVISTNVRFGVVAGILQTVSLTKLLADEDKALANESTDASLRAQAGIAALASTTSEVIGRALEARAAQGLRFGQGLFQATGRFLARWGARAGVLTGAFVAALDFTKAHTEYSEGASGLVVAAYVASGVLGIGLTVALMSGAALPVIGVLIVLIIGIAILIEYIKDNPIQDWMERCPWGKLTDQRYRDMKTEQAQLKLALE